MRRKFKEEKMKQPEAPTFRKNLDSSTYRTHGSRQLQPMNFILPIVIAIIGLISLLGISNPQRFPPSPMIENEVQKIVPSEPRATEQITSRDADALAEPDLNEASQLAPFFEPSILYWEADIIRWANRHNMDPDMVATIMLIESCGDPQAVSRAGAMGLFQVMPFHFEVGEDGFDPETNSLRGMNYLAERLIQTNGEIGHAFAGYNGGHVAAGGSWSNWPDEVKRYFTWTTGVYKDALAGNVTSQTMEQWLAAGGSSLCAQARQRLGLK